MSETPLKTLGKYEIRKVLGKGAMGIVYLGFDPDLEREVALKVMAGAIVADDELKERFMREAKAVARLQHPNIVSVYDLGYDEQESPYIAMEYLKGHDLEHHLRRDPLTFREKLSVIAQTCRGLSHAHKAGIVHRDIKPANIFITDGGDAKIMDFGVARWEAQSHTQTGAVLGTADYMSPEQIRGQKVDGRSDIFAVGVILYRLLTNKKPFAGENIQAVFFKVLNQEPPELLLPEGSQMPELQSIVDKALSKNADDRYATADDLAEDLSDLMGLYQDLLNEDTVFDTMFDPSANVDVEPGSDASGRKRTSSTGRIFGTSGTGGVSRTHRPGGSYPSTVAGKAVRTSAGRTTAMAPTRMLGRTQAGSAPRSVGIPIEESSGFWKYLAAAVLLVAVGGGVYWATQGGSPPVGDAGTNVAGPNLPPPPAEPTLEERLQAVRTAIDGGLLNAATNRVENILLEYPDNAEALALRAEIESSQQSAQTATPTPTEAPPSDPRPSGPSASERAATLAADASLEINSGNLERAEQLIRQGRGFAPSDPRWQRLTGLLEAARDNEARNAELVERQRAVNQHLSEGANHMKSQSFEAAIAAYEKALEIDPSNAAAISGKIGAENALAQQQAASVTALKLSETKTEFVSADGGNTAPKGFEAGGVDVQRATQAADNPGTVIINIRPLTVQPGDPYTLEVRVQNEGNRPLMVKTLEIISTFSGQTQGRGQMLQPLVQNVNPRDTSLVWKYEGSSWREEQKTGSIEAVVTLVGDAKLKKTISWQ